MGEKRRETGVRERKRKKDKKRDRSGREGGRERERTAEKKRGRDGREKEERETRLGEKEIQRKTGLERDRERENITNTKNSWNFILTCFTAFCGVKHDSGLLHYRCRTTIHCRTSIRLPDLSSRQLCILNPKLM